MMCEFFFYSLKKWLLSFFLLCPFLLLGQTIADIRSHNLTQLISFPQEKVYIHTDKATYVSGEKIWYRIYLVNAALHRSDLAPSRFVYVDLVDPMGRVLSHSMIRPDGNDLYHNNIELPDDLPEGHYLIRGYTRYMLNRPDYLFEKKVFVSDPLSYAVGIDVRFSQAGRQGIAAMDFRDKEGTPIAADKYMAGVDTTENLPTFTKGKDFTFRILPDKKQTLYVAFEYNNRVFRKYISVPDMEEKFDVSFYPEGGYLMADTLNVVGFKALNTKGLSELVTVKVFEKGGELITEAVSNALGMGKLTLYSQAGKQYEAICTNQEGVTTTVALPQAREEVYTLHARWGTEHLRVLVRQGSQAPERGGSMVLLLHVRGQVVFCEEVSAGTWVTLDKELFPSGVVHILLMDDQCNPLSERLVFCMNNDQAVAKIHTDKSNYAKRGHVQVEVDVSGADGLPQSGNYSVSVTDNKDLLPDRDCTIGSVLLLSSDLRGNIESPGYYFEETTDRTSELDALLLTQGWRRYQLAEVAKGALEAPAKAAEVTQQVSGFLRYTGNGRAAAEQLLYLISTQIGFLSETVTDGNGRFVFEGLEHPDSTGYILHTAAKGRETEFVLDTPPVVKGQPWATPMSLSKNLFDQAQSTTQFNEYLKKSDTKFLLEGGIRTRELKPAIVIAEQTKRPQPRSLYSSGAATLISSQAIEKEAYSTTLATLVRKYVPGLQIIESIDSPPIFYFVSNMYGQGGGPAIIVIDDVVVDDWSLSEIPLWNIASIEATRTAPLLGSRGGARGAIMITTKKEATPVAPYMDRTIQKITPVGYKGSVEFYAPKYETDAQRYNGKPDLRTTLYWKSDNILVNGKSAFDFYAADAETTYSIVIEGITEDGKVIRALKQVVRDL